MCQYIPRGELDKQVVKNKNVSTTIIQWSFFIDMNQFILVFMIYLLSERFGAVHKIILHRISKITLIKGKVN